MHDTFFTLERIGEIVGKNPSTLRTHISRGYVVGTGPRQSAGNKDRGKHERFSVNTLTEFALAYRLEQAGLGLKLAFDYAGQFAHSGGSVRLRLGAADETRRLPGLPYHYRHGDTLMGMLGGQSDEVLERADQIEELHTNLALRAGLTRSAPLIVVNVTDFFRELCGALGLDYRVILDDAYPEGDRG